MSYLIEHSALFDGIMVDGHCNWFPAAFVAVALGIMIFCWTKVKKMKQEKEQLEQQLSSKAADASIGGPAEL